MTATVSRELSITYGSLTVGGTSDYLIDRVYRLRKSYRAFEVSFRVVVTGDLADVDSTFATDCLAVEAAFRTPREDLTIAFNASQHVDLEEGVTAFDIQPSCEKVGEEDGPDTRRSRAYALTVTGKLPADETGEGFADGVTWTLEWDASRRRTITIEGTYTRNGATGSLATYEAAIATRAAAIITLAGGGTFEIVNERATPDQHDDETRFAIRYSEVIYNQAVGALDDPDIVDQALVVRRSRVGPGDTPTVKRLQRVVIAYSAAIDKEVTTDLLGKWTGKIRPWLLANVRAFAGSSTVALEDESPEFNGPDNRINASMTVLATTGSGTLSQTVTTRDERDRNKSIRKQWGQIGNVDGDRMDPPKARVLRGPVTIRRTVTTIQEVLGNVSPPGPAVGGQGGAGGILAGIQPPGASAFTVNGSSGNALGVFGIGQTLGFGFSPAALAGGGAGGAGGATPAQFPGPKWEDVGVVSDSYTPIRYGQGSEAFDVTRIERVRVYEWIDIDAGAGNRVGSGGNAAGGSRTVPRTT